MKLTQVLIKAWNERLGRAHNVHATGNALHVLNEANAATHQRESYHLGMKINLAPDQVAFLAATPNSYYMHWNGLTLQADTGPVEVEFYGDVAVASGTPLSPVNNWLEVTSSCSAEVVQVNVLTTTGTLVVPMVNLATPTLGGKTLPATETGLFDGFVLNRGSTYAVGMKNTSSDSASLWANFGFIEPKHI